MLERVSENLNILTVLKKFLDLDGDDCYPVLKMLKCGLVVEIYFVEGYVCNSRS